MEKKITWRSTNIEEIRKRTIKYSILNYGKIVKLNNNNEIDLMQVTDNVPAILKSNIFLYEDMKNAMSIDERISIVVNAVRDFSFYFYFDERVTDLIING